MGSYYKGRIAYARWEWADPYQSNLWTACTVSVYRPSYDYPHVSVLVAIANGGGKCFMRCKSLAEAQTRVVIPKQYLDRLHLAETQAISEMVTINDDIRLLREARRPGARIVNTDTGEILADAERIIRGED